MAPVGRLEAGGDGGEVGGLEGVVDALGLGGEGGGGGGIGEGGDGGVGIARVEERGGELGPAVLGDEAVGEAGADGVARPHAVAGEAEVFAEPAGSGGEDRGGADVGDEADGAFGHRDPGRRTDDAVAAMAGDADAAAHDEALHQGDAGLGVARHPGVHPVLVGPEARPRGEVAAAAAGIDLGDVAAGAEGARALGVDEDEGDGIVALPRGQRRIDVADHGVGEGVERLRAGEGDAAGAPLGADVQVAHAVSASRARATITRMISLVPSRIWWTRRSRTIFSMP